MNSTIDSKKKKKRPLLKVFLGVVAFSLLVCGGVVTKFVFILNRQPTISVDYLAKLNERAMAVPEDQRAWPIYQEALGRLRVAAGTRSGVLWDDAHWAWPGDDHWEEVQIFLRDHAAEIEMIREAAAMPEAGFIVHSETAGMQLLVSEVDYLELGVWRQAARLLRTDTWSALDHGDGTQFMANVEAVEGIATHAGEHEMVLCQLVQMAIRGLLWQVIHGAVAQFPDALSDNHLVQIEELVDGHLDAYSASPRFGAERYFAYDLLQRWYTDDGNGDGLISPSGIVGTAPSATAELLFEGLRAPFAISRSEMKDRVDAVYDAGDDLIQVPYYLWDKTELNAATDKIRFNNLDRGLDTFSLFLPASERVAQSWRRAVATCNATKIVIALERHRRKHGEWPATLDTIDPAILADVPNDDFTGEPFIYRLVDGEPLLYSVGFDGVDNGGLHSSHAFEYQYEESDWVFFPPPPREED